MLLDSHCHLTHQKFADEEWDVERILAEAKQANVHECLHICCRIRNEFDALILPTAEKYDGVWCTVGTHPHEASNELYSVEDIASRTAHEKVIGIGECGLDYYYDFAAPNDQKTVFRNHIRACLETDLPIVIHARDADNDIMDIIGDEDPGQKLRGILHCFSSSQALAEFGIERGLYISFSGMLTFKNNQFLRDIAARVPMDQILIETDAPYLAPMPHRGQTNRPAFVQYTAQCLAGIFDKTEAEIAQITRRNFFTLFTKAVPLQDVA